MRGGEETVAMRWWDGKRNEPVSLHFLSSVLSEELCVNILFLFRSRALGFLPLWCFAGIRVGCFLNGCCYGRPGKLGI